MHDVMMQSSPVLSLSSGFSSYSSLEEFRADSNLDPVHDLTSLHEQNPHKENDFREEIHQNAPENAGDREEFGENAQTGFHEDALDEMKREANGVEDSKEKLTNEEIEEKEDEDEDEEEEFEFPSIDRNSVSSPVPADEIFYNGQIRPLYSVPGNHLQVTGNGLAKLRKEAVPPRAEAVRHPLRLLFLEDRDPPSSCSSSEADELEGVPPETYCIWEPKMAVTAAVGVKVVGEGQCKNSNSTGSSKRWRLRNFLNRSNSEGGRGRIVFPTPDEPNHGKKRDEKFEKSKGTGVKAPPSAAEQQFGKSGGGEKLRQSSLPYRQDMMGFFGNANGTNWNLHPF